MVLLANSLNNAQREVDILSTFKSRGMDGVLIAPGNERNRAVLDAVASLGIATVILDRDMTSTQDRVQFDHLPAMRSAVSYLIGLGHRRIALIVTQTPSRPMRRRIEGFRAAFLLHGLTVPVDLIVKLPSSQSSSFSAASLLLAQPDTRPTAIVALGTNILNETLNAISTQRLRIPEDVSVISIGDPDFARSYAPAISALRVDLEGAAEQSVTLLLDRIRHGVDAKPRTVKVSSDFILRQSCGPVPTGFTSRA